ncbi:hypothetical protein EW146_g2953 [Bondarzewia mesenterica]|uniref:Phospholipid/glycerol acyltransferase domain-containing protein n=1 Tax=Bondarzewia mesenterica TaxID=1095465 RepID=A0A4S4LZJ6_9AGAM|nr:hypothetical protein EW146_g2953 [Bondarzewia mesenterica]
MEKYSAFRDPGTGIQPFLTPVPPSGSNVLAKLALPLGFVLGIFRTAIILILAFLHTVLVQGICFVLLPIPAVHRSVTYVITAVVCRSALFLLGLFWIPVENVTRKRGRVGKNEESWSPKAGDLIVSNWVSWIEILWLAFRFNPVFVLPVSSSETTPSVVRASTPTTSTPGRRMGTGSAAISAPSTRSSSTPISIIGFRQVSLLSILRSTGEVPLFNAILDDTKGNSLEEIRKTASRPVVVFPECTTSNGRGLLRFAELFSGRDVPTGGCKVFVMCIRYDPPSAFSPTLTHSIPTLLNPVPHLFTLTTALKPLTASIRLLAPSESPSYPTFLVNEVVSGNIGCDVLWTTCGELIMQMGKLKKNRDGMGRQGRVLRLLSRKEEVGDICGRISRGLVCCL